MNDCLLVMSTAMLRMVSGDILKLAPVEKSGMEWWHRYLPFVILIFLSFDLIEIARQHGEMLILLFVTCS